MNNSITTINGCRICNSSIRPLFLAAGWPLVSCNVCEFHQVDKKPSQDDITKIYSNKYFVGSKYDDNNFSQKKEFERRLKILRKYVPKNSKIIDVGCGIGDFVSAAKTEYDIWGHDISEDAIREAKANLPDIAEKLRAGMIEDTEYPEHFFDAVILWDVIEHLWDPRLVVEQLFKYLKPGGFLIFSTPNADALTAKVMKTKWAFMTPPEHLGFFGKKSVYKLFSGELNHKVKFYTSKGKWVNLGFLMYKLDKVFKNKITQFLKKIFSGVFNFVPLYIPTGDIMYVVIEKEK